MPIEIGMENNMEGRSIAWALNLPGCFAYGMNAEQAFAALPETLAGYVQWISNHQPGIDWLDEKPPRLELVETWDTYHIDENFNLVQEGYEVNAWFRHDWKPLTEQDVERGRLLLSWSRQDLLDTVKDLDTEALQLDYPGQRWNIGGILRHVAIAEWWYLDRLDFAPSRAEAPKDHSGRLDFMRARLLEMLPKWVGKFQVVGKDGEIWSPRKVLRRAIWHERDHTFHIQELLRTSA